MSAVVDMHFTNNQIKKMQNKVKLDHFKGIDMMLIFFRAGV